MTSKSWRVLVRLLKLPIVGNLELFLTASPVSMGLSVRNGRTGFSGTQRDYLSQVESRMSDSYYRQLVHMNQCRGIAL